jgi:hypothetical protein
LYSFVDAIVQREASEKWLSKVAGDVMEPLLSVEEHHQLLSLIAQEMWLSSSTSLRYDLLDTIVDLFAEGAKKPAAATRQIRERIRQHSLLAVESARGQALAFDHEDFQSFYIGEWLGYSIAKGARAEVQALLSVTLVPRIASEQAVQHLVRHKHSFAEALQLISAVSGSESGFSFCKENCGTLAVRIVELMEPNAQPIVLEGMFFSGGVLSGRMLGSVNFQHCHFQPTGLGSTDVGRLRFTECAFERLELMDASNLKGCQFEQCDIDSLLRRPQEEHLFAPNAIAAALRAAGATVDNGTQASLPLEAKDDDPRIKIFERFLRSFLKRTHIDDDLIRVRLGKGGAPLFYAEMLPLLLANGILEKVPYKGQGVQERYKLAVRLAEIDSALKDSRGDFEALLRKLKGK